MKQQEYDRPQTEDGVIAPAIEEKDGEGPVSRRRALIAGLTAAPVVLTLMNTSAWGANCSNATVTSFQQQGGLTASFQRRHPNATVNSGGQLKCGEG